MPDEMPHSATPAAQPDGTPPAATSAEGSLTYEQIAAEIERETRSAAATPAATPAAATTEPEEVVVTTSTGQVYKGKNKDEVIEALKRAQEHATATIRDLKDVATGRAAPAAGPEKKTFDKAHYYKLLEDDPIQAQDYLDSYRPNAQQVYTTVEELRQGGELTKFLNSCQDFPVTDPQAVAAMRQRLTQEGRQPTADNLELVYSRLVREGTIKPVPINAKSEPLPRPNPTLGGTSAGAVDLLAGIERLSDVELEKVLRKQGLLLT